MSEIRISPNGRDVAIRNRDGGYAPWRVTDGSYRSDLQVADWTVLTAAPTGPEPRTEHVLTGAEPDGLCPICDECDGDDGHDGPHDCGHEARTDAAVGR